MFHRHYYYQKYPYLNYDYRDHDGKYIMFSIPPELLAAAFAQKMGYAPKTFFDCGAATGEIVWRAEKLGMDARGIDIRKYPYQNAKLADLFIKEKIKICSVLDCQPITSDLVFCNGTLTYFDEDTLPHVLSKFNQSKTLYAIHNTTEDIAAARANHDILSTCSRLRLVRPQDWWMETFDKNGFDTEYNSHLQCFCATPRKEH